MQLTDDLTEDYHDKWICDESWFRILNDKYPHLSQSFDFRQEHISLYLHELVGGFNEINANGVYHKVFKAVLL